MSTMTNQGFFVKDFELDRLINLVMISDHGLQVLTKGDDVANWAKFWAFLFKASTVAQHLLGSTNVDALKNQLSKAKDSMNSTLQANMKLVEDNKSLEDRVLALTIEDKGLETRAANAEALVKSREGEVAKLRFSLAVVEKER